MKVNEALFFNGVDDLVTRFNNGSIGEKKYLKSFYFKILKSKRQRKQYDIRKLLNTIDLLHILEQISSKRKWQSEIGNEKLFIEVIGNDKYPECNHLRSKLFEIDYILETMPLSLYATHDNLLRGCSYWVTSENSFKKKEQNINAEKRKT